MIGPYTLGVWLERMCVGLAYVGLSCLALFVLFATLSNGWWALLVPTALIPAWLAWELLDALVMTRVPTRTDWAFPSPRK